MGQISVPIHFLAEKAGKLSRIGLVQVSRYRKEMDFAVEISPLPAGDFFCPSTVESPEAGPEAEKKCP